MATFTKSERNEERLEAGLKKLLDEAENERMHLMIFIEIAKPNAFERYIILFAQAVFWNFYFLLYVFFPKLLTEWLVILRSKR